MESVLFIGAGCSFGQETIEEIIEKYDKLYLTESEMYFKELEQSVMYLKEQYKNKYFELISLDVTKVNDIWKTIKQIETAGDSITAFIYAAGINVILPALSVTEDVWDRVNDINLKGFFFSAKEVISHMLLHGLGGNIVAIASQHGVVANVDRAPYCASKAGLINLARELALEFAEKNINVNVVSPTFILSDRNKMLLKKPRFVQMYQFQIPQKKYATPQDMANAISFLIDKKTGGITGHNLLVDGGWTIR